MLFDIVNTLLKYFGSGEFPEILRRALREVRDYLDVARRLFTSSLGE
jgi:hypothetical protein